MDARGYLSAQGVEEALAKAVAEVIKERPSDALGRISDILKPPAEGPLDTRSLAVFNADLMAKGIASLHLNLIGLGDELGYFTVLLGGPQTPGALATKAGCNERYTKEWCISMASGKVLVYNEANGTFSIPEQLREAFSVPQNPAGLIWGTLTPSITDMRAKLAVVFREGGGIDWVERDQRLMSTTCNFFKPLYEGMLVDALPAEVKTKLQGSAALADVGCGQGVSCCVLGAAFPKASVFGFDYHAPAIESATALAGSKGLGNVKFAVAKADSFGEEGSFDVCAFLDCFHDFAKASAAATRAALTLKPDGLVFLIEPMGASTDSPAEQISLPPAPMFSAISCHLCLPCSMVNGGEGLGTICPTSRHEQIFLKAGFKSVSAVPSSVNGAGFRMIVAKK